MKSKTIINDGLKLWEPKSDIDSFLHSTNQHSDKGEVIKDLSHFKSSELGLSFVIKKLTFKLVNSEKDDSRKDRHRVWDGSKF